MAGNFGKYYDRMPIICAAGKPSGDPTKNVKECLQHYLIQEQVDALKHDGGIFEEHRQPFEYKLLKAKNKRHQGIYTDAREAIRPPDKTNYQTLINDLKETSYDSYWNKSLGKCRDPIPGLPAGMEPLNVTFGKPSKKEIPMKELVNPPKGVYQVLWDSQVAHDWYKKTHNDYNPGEHIDRGYSRPAYNPDKRYGGKTTFDPRGIWVKCACHWYKSEPVNSTSLIQAEVLERTRPVLGKVLAPNKNIECVPKDFAFGKKLKREMYGMNELLKDQDCPPCIFKRDFHDWVKALNQLRNVLKRKNSFIFDRKKFRDSIIYYDKEYSGWMPIKFLHEMCECHKVNYEHKALDPLFYLLGIFVEDKANYDAFLDIIDVNKPMPELFKMNDIPENNLYYITTSQAGACDYLKIDNSDHRPAGVPSVRFDLLWSVVPDGGCQADLENLGDETTAGALINPSIYTNYGINHRDFFTPRSPETIRKLFENIGYTFTEDTFDKLWEIGIQHDKTGLVCVDTFNKLVKKYFPLPVKTMKSEITTESCKN